MSFFESRGLIQISPCSGAKTGISSISASFNEIEREHSGLLKSFFELRKRTFIDNLGWELPSEDQMERDQYDNPTARYCFVLANDELLAGARLHHVSAFHDGWRTLALDASKGLLPGIPRDILKDVKLNEYSWECTRFVVSRLETPVARKVLLGLVDQTISCVRELGGESIISLSPPSMRRLLMSFDLQCEMSPETLNFQNDTREYRVLTTAVPSSKELRGLTGAHSPARAIKGI